MCLLKTTLPGINTLVRLPTSTELIQHPPHERTNQHPKRLASTFFVRHECDDSFDTVVTTIANRLTLRVILDHVVSASFGRCVWRTPIVSYSRADSASLRVWTAPTISIRSATSSELSSLIASPERPNLGSSPKGTHGHIQTHSRSQLQGVSEISSALASVAPPSHRFALLIVLLSECNRTIGSEAGTGFR